MKNNIISNLMVLNVLFSGIILSSSIMLFLMGSKVLKTKLHALFWFIIFLYSISYSFYNLKILPSISVYYAYIQLFIPGFYLLFNFSDNNYKKIFPVILSFAFPVLIILFKTLDVLLILYNPLFWISILIYYYIIQKKENKKSPFPFFQVLVVIVISVFFPFIFSYIIFKKISITFILILHPFFLATGSLCLLYFSYKNDIITLNHAYYHDINFLKRAIDYEKRNITEKTTASLIHEIKNPVSASLSLIQQLLDPSLDFDENEKTQYYKMIETQLEKIKQLCSTNLDLNKIHFSIKHDFTEFFINESIFSTYRLLKSDFDKKNIKFTLINKNDIKIRFSEQIFNQVLLNIFYNALDAAYKEISVWWETDNNKKILNLFIRNDGEKIDDKFANKIFAPFFSTKVNGTGMGLTICKELLNKIESDIVLFKNKSHDIVFKIILKN